MTTDGEVEIVLVEDSENDAELTLRALEKGHLQRRVHLARDGVEALDFLFGRGSHADREDAQPPKVVLLDLKMPRVGGFEVLRQLKEDSHRKTIPVVVLTSSSEDLDVERAYDLGANSYIVKPVDAEAFVHAVSTAGLYWLVINRAAR